ncbi:MAG: XRE family transcriptional regulator [Christensenella sp.]|nr:XRE family transcriptional regulator [Christensenella sp.]
MLRESFFKSLELFLKENKAYGIRFSRKDLPDRKTSSPRGKMGDKLLSFIGLEPTEDETSSLEEICEDSDEDFEDFDIDDFINDHKNVTFSEKLFQYIDQKIMIDTYVYKKAGIDRRHFSKIRSKTYHPGKGTVILLGLALELNLPEIKDLLDSAGYSLSKSSTADLIIEFCIINHVYNVMDINLVLDRFQQKTLEEMK